MRPTIYLDHNATTPVDKRVLVEMLPYFTGSFGNAASATHGLGREAAGAVESARSEVAALIRAEPKDVVFTSGATEAINLALTGAMRGYRERGRHLVTVATEHRAVLETCERLRDEGCEVTVLPVDRLGRVDPAAVVAALRPDTVLLACMFANNEIGTIHDIAALGQLTRAAGVLFHVDAAQALGKEAIDVDAMGIDLMSLSAHKIYGPKGVGALYVRRRNPRVRLTALMSGGGQERGLRPGTLNVPGIVGFGVACALAREALDADPGSAPLRGAQEAQPGSAPRRGARETQENTATERDRISQLRNRLWQRLSSLGNVERLGDPDHVLAGTLSVAIYGVDARRLLVETPTIAASLGAACASVTPEPSHVLRAIGLNWRQAEGVVRLSLGRFTTAAEIDTAADLLAANIARLRTATPTLSPAPALSSAPAPSSAPATSTV